LKLFGVVLPLNSRGDGWYKYPDTEWPFYASVSPASGERLEAFAFLSLFIGMRSTITWSEHGETPRAALRKVARKCRKQLREWSPMYLAALDFAGVTTEDLT
jgi:hypothetical protein